MAFLMLATVRQLSCEPKKLCIVGLLMKLGLVESLTPIPSATNLRKYTKPSIPRNPNGILTKLALKIYLKEASLLSNKVIRDILL